MFYTYAKQQVVIGVSFTFLGASRQISNQIEEKIILVTRSLVTWSSREHNISRDIHPYLIYGIESSDMSL